jgi:hypothetical protein
MVGDFRGVGGFIGLYLAFLGWTQRHVGVVVGGPRV